MKLALFVVALLLLTVQPSSSSACGSGCIRKSLKRKMRITVVHRSPLLKDQWWWRKLRAPTGSAPRSFELPFGPPFGQPQLPIGSFRSPLIIPVSPFGIPVSPPT